MKYFQIAAFIFEMLICIGFIICGVINLLKIKTKKPNCWIRKNNRYDIIKAVATRIVISLLCIGGAVYFIIPMLKDVPILISGNFYVVGGYPEIGERGSKDFYQHVYINDTEVDFFFESNVKTDKYYMVSYLPNSNRGIDAQEMDEVNDSYSKGENHVKSPLIEFLLIMGIILAMYLLYRIGFILLAIGSAIYYPLNIYFYFRDCRVTGKWVFVSDNGALNNVLVGIILLTLVGFIYFAERFAIKRRVGKYSFKNNSYKDEYIATRGFSNMAVGLYIMFTLSYLKMI